MCLLQMEIKSVNFDQIRILLKELHKQIRNLNHFKERDITIFEQKEANQLIDRLQKIAKMIKKDKNKRVQAI